MSLPEKAFPVSWDQFHRDARALAWRLAGLGRDFRAIVCITRGGLVPAAIISRELNIRLIDTVCVASYHDYVNQGEFNLLKGIAPELTADGGDGVLVIDDLTDTGKTASEVRSLMRRRISPASMPSRRVFPRSTLHHRSFAGHLDLFPLGYGLYLPGADRQGPQGLRPFCLPDLETRRTGGFQTADKPWPHPGVVIHWDM